MTQPRFSNISLISKWKEAFTVCKQIKMAVTRKPQSEPISFRATREILGRIDISCDELKISRGTWVKCAVIEKLQTKDEEARELHSELVEMIQSLDKEQKDLRVLLARLLHIILVYVGELPVDQSKSVVKSKLLREDS